MGKFSEVVENELSQLASSLRHYWPVSSQMLNILLLKIQGRFTSQTLVDFFVYTGERSEDGCDDPFVVARQCPNIHGLHCYVFRIPTIGVTPEMVQALEELVDWKKVDVFSAVPQTFYDDHLSHLCHKYGGPKSDLPCEAHVLSDSNLALSYPIKYTLENGSDKVEVRPLEVADTDYILADYPWTRPHSKLQTELAIRNCASSGVFVTTPEGKETLASYAVLSPVGLLNILATEEGFQRRGFAGHVLKSLGASVSAMGLTPRAENVVGNEASKKVQERAGFIFVDKTNWIKFK